jgi:5'-3' exonuclease
VRLLPEDCTLYRKSIDDEIRRIENSLEYISTKEFDCTKELFSICGVPFIDSKGEAEATCSVMNKTGIVAAVLTDDTDVMACMAPVMLYKLNFEDQTCTEITIQDVLEALELQPSQFIDFCIMCGTDYNGSIQKIGCEKAYKLIREFQTIENIDQYTDIPVTVFNHVRTREIFNMDAISSSDDYRIPPRRPIDKKRLVEFCFTNNCEFDIERFFYTADATRSGHIRMIKPF